MRRFVSETTYTTTKTSHGTTGNGFHFVCNYSGMREE